MSATTHTHGESTPHGAPAATFPPVAELATGALALIVIGGIVMATYAPRRPPLLLPTILLIASLVMLGTAVALLTRTRDFAWRTFVRVDRWALVAYTIAAGLIEFAFVKDHTRGAPLVVLTMMLVDFAVSVPLIIAFTVAKFANREA